MSTEFKNFNFGEALEALKQGRTIARSGWNGKNMFVYLNIGSAENLQPKTEGASRPNIGGVSQDLFALGDVGTVTRMPNINMKAADGSTVTGWLASQTDLLAEDWNILN